MPARTDVSPSATAATTNTTTVDLDPVHVVERVRLALLLELAWVVVVVVARVRVELRRAAARAAVAVVRVRRRAPAAREALPEGPQGGHADADYGDAQLAACPHDRVGSGVWWGLDRQQLRTLSSWCGRKREEVGGGDMYVIMLHSHR